MARHAKNALEALLVDRTFDADVYPNEPMSRHTMYRIGGKCKYYIQVASIGALRQLLCACEEAAIPWMVVGRGSNLLVSDAGFNGVIITLGRDFRTHRFDEKKNEFYVGAGVAFSAVVQDAFHKCLSGLEFGVGVPGTIGGAIRMNAGTRDAGIGNSIVSVTTFSPTEGLVREEGNKIEWGYRSTSFPDNAVIVECEIAVKPADPYMLRAKMEASHTRRKQTQPLTQPSCGSVFKNPEGQSAGRLIQSVGLKGKCIGGAQISQKHANFIVNVNNASANDVLSLMKLAKSKVFEEYGIELKPEVRLIGQ